MKKFLMFAIAIVALVGCNNEELENAGSLVKKGDLISFGSGVLDTRTVYEHTDATQINWVDGDVIRVYCKNAQVGQITGTDAEGNPIATVTNANAAGEMVYADYKVTSVADNKAQGTLAPSDANNVLLWGEGNHKFFAVYPADAATSITEEGVVTFPINRNQVCTVLTADQVTDDNTANDKADYTYIATPDMDNQYMCAKSESTPTKGDVWLKFNPIMTTINIVLKGPIDSTNESNANVDEVEITGVSVVSRAHATTNDKTTFQYDIENGENTGTAGLVGKDENGNQLYDSQTTFISFDGSNIADSSDSSSTINTITLDYGETLSVTAFLPPMSLKTMNDLDRSVTMRVHTIGGSRSLTIEKADLTNQSWEEDKFLSPSAKGKVTLPNIYTPISGANWITPLDNDIYVAQLSIPGTHDAATSTIEAYGAGKCQSLSITEQLNIGIRYFDLRPTCPKESVDATENVNLQINHGTVNSGSTMKSVFDQFRTFLGTEASKDEFIIAMVKWEQEGDANFSEGFLGFGAKNDPTNFHTNFANLLKTYDDIIADVTFSKDLTIKDLRGKVLILIRPTQDWADNHAKAFYAREALPGTVFLNNYPGGDNNKNSNETAYFWLTNEQENMLASSVHVGNLYVQDYWSVDDSDTKMTIIADHLDKSAKTHTTAPHNSIENVWYINHFSGYTESTSVIKGYSFQYASNAQSVNNLMYSYILGEPTTIAGTSRTKPIGSTGIVVMDFAGDRSLSTGESIGGSFVGTVYGDLLPQTIIDNNYKFEMKRRKKTN